MFAVALGFPIAGVLPALPLQAQQLQAALSGLVKDQSGTPIAGATVTVRSGETVVVQTTTDGNGLFRFSGAPAQYRVDITAGNFQPIRDAEIPFSADGPSQFTLDTGLFGTTETARSSHRPPARPGASRLGESPVQQEADRRPWEMGVLFQGGLGLTENRSGFRFLLAGAHVGKVLTTGSGSGLLRGNFEYAAEVLPYWQAFTPRFQKVSCGADPGATIYSCSAPYTVGGTYSGVSVTPIMLRWNFTHGERWMPWVQGAGGLVWTDHKFPAVGNLNRGDLSSNGIHGDTSVWNFTPQFGVGTHLFVRAHRSLDFSANAVHISSASLGDRNPGVNASVQFSLGYAWWK